MNSEKSIMWKLIPGTNGFYQISDRGNVRVIKKEFRNFNINNLLGSIYAPARIYLHTRTIGNSKVKVPYAAFERSFEKKLQAVSTLMYLAFHGIENTEPEEIFHLDGDECNNSLNNLFFCEKKTKSNLAKMFYNEEANRIIVDSKVDIGYKMISEYALNGIRQNVYSSAHAATKITGVPFHIIKLITNGSKMLAHEGRIFKRGYGPYSIETKLIKERMLFFNPENHNSLSRFILQFSKNGKLIRVYESCYEAAIFNNIETELIRKAALKGKLLGNYLWILDGIPARKVMVDSDFQ